ncbi:MAG: hypothetical protein IMY73_05540, partial [Bacteroidetes bacterium]|nr:hypothetical protein [Bacteroidota bacterium]
MKHTYPNDSLFQFVKTLSKAEKRNFRLFATRQTSNENSLFVALFDILDYSDSYDEKKIKEKLKIKKTQLSNIKNHLYNQLLISCRLLQSKHSKQIGLREQIDFANILYN